MAAIDAAFLQACAGTKRDRVWGPLRDELEDLLAQGVAVDLITAAIHSGPAGEGVPLKMSRIRSAVILGAVPEPKRSGPAQWAPVAEPEVAPPDPAELERARAELEAMRKRMAGDGERETGS